MKLKAHRNLNSPNKRIDWSFTPLHGGHKGKVLGYAAFIELSDVFFRVQPKGLENVRKAGVRSVIAWAEGSVDTCAVREFRYPEHDYDLYVTEDLTSKLDAQEWVQIRFDAFEGAPFFTIASNGQPVTHADKVLLSDTGACYAINPRFEEAKPKGKAKAKASPAPQELALF